MRTRTKGILLAGSERIVNKQYRGQRIFQRLGTASQDSAEAWLRRRQEEIDAEADRQLRQGNEQLFRTAAGKYLMELRQATDIRTLDTISGHVLLLNQWVGDETLGDMCNDTFNPFKADRLTGRNIKGEPVRPVKAATINRSLEVARTVLNRAARVWRTNGKPWLPTAPLIEMMDESGKRKPYPISWAQQAQLVPVLAEHLQRPVLFALNTGARDDNVCGLRWSWEVPVPELERSVFVIPAAEFKGKRDHVLVLNDTAWSIVESCRGEHGEYVFTYTPPAPKKGIAKRPQVPNRINTLNNTGWQRARAAVGLERMRVHDLRHTFGQRLRDAGVSEEDRALLLGHAIEGMPQHYATATVARLVEAANKAQHTVDRTTLLRVVNG